MSTRRSKPPKLCLHKSTGQAFVKIAGKPLYLGKYGSAKAHRAYAQILKQLNEQAEAQPEEPAALYLPRDCEDLTIVELIAAYWQWAEGHYVKHGERTRTLDNIRLALRPLVELYGALRVREFGPLKLKQLRDWMIDQKTPAGVPPSRGVVNERVRIVCDVFEWGVENELVPETIHRALRAVRGLQAGRSKARETKPVAAVPDPVIEATIAKLPPVLADLVRFQRLTGCRPGEACSIRPGDVVRFDRPEGELPLFAGDRDAGPPRELPVWEYWPARHKTEHHGRQRVVLIGPQAQEVLRPYLLRPPEAYCFSPAESETKRRLRAGHAVRKPRPVAERYTKDSYAQAIVRACDLAYPPPEDMDAAEIRVWRKAHRWRPNRLRHTAGTAIRKRYGLEKARVVLGHAKTSTTEIYAEKDREEAAAIVLKMG